MSICPICGEEVTPRCANKAFPFCSARCKSIDLGKWLTEEYRVPTVPDESGEGGEGDDCDARLLELQAAASKPDMRH